jgi:hypothetical protein
VVESTVENGVKGSVAVQGGSGVERGKDSKSVAARMRSLAGEMW